MDALVMCGGRGTRLDADTEKPLVAVSGEPMVDRVLGALTDSRVDTVYAAVSPHTAGTRAHVRECVPVVETPGEGYVADLGVALDDDRLSRPVLTVAADLPLLDGGGVDRVLDAYEESVTGGGREGRDRDRDGTAGSLTVAVPAERKRDLGVSVDTTFEDDGRELAPAGLNVVGDDEHGTTLVVDDARLAVNVNRPADLAVAERLAGT